MLDGGLVSIGAPTVGLRTYVAVGGGLATPAVLGSRSADVLSNWAEGRCARETCLAVGPGRLVLDPSPPAAAPPPAIPVSRRAGQLRGCGSSAVRGSTCSNDELDALLGSIYTVSPASNRTGLRLIGRRRSRLPAASCRARGW